MRNVEAWQKYDARAGNYALLYFVAFVVFLVAVFAMAATMNAMPEEKSLVWPIIGLVSALIGFKAADRSCENAYMAVKDL